jgi:short-subunit dehydrogenase
MIRLSRERRQAHDVGIAVEPLDLTGRNAAYVLEENLQARGIAPDVPVNNAAKAYVISLAVQLSMMKG